MTITLLEDVSILKSGRPATHPEFFGFNNWHEVAEFVEQPEGEQLFTFVKIVKRFGERTIIEALDRTASNENDGDLILSTAHKAKGLEWPTVMLADDFREPIKVSRDNEDQLKKENCIFVEKQGGNRYAFKQEEVRLLYVATTRAQQAVHLPYWCESFFDVEQAESTLEFKPVPQPEPEGGHGVAGPDGVTDTKKPVPQPEPEGGHGVAGPDGVTDTKKPVPQPESEKAGENSQRNWFLIILVIALLLYFFSQ